MAFSSEVTGKLGIDTSSVPADLAKAKGAFQTFGNDIENAAGKHGEGAGDKLTHALEHKLLGSRHLAGALATALGLNLEHIAENIAAAIVGGSKEAWAEAVKLADENTKIIEQLIETRLNPKQLQEKRQKDLDRAVEESSGAGKQTALGQAVEKLGFFGTNLRYIGQAFGLIKTDAQRLEETSKSTLEVNEKDLIIQKEKTKGRELDVKYAEAYEDYLTKNLHGEEKINAIREEAEKLQAKIDSGELADNEAKQAKLKVLALIVALGDEETRQAQEKITKERELAKLKESTFEAQRKLNKDEQELAQKKSDLGKTTLGELADIDANRQSTAKRDYKSGDSTFGLSDQVAAARQAARDIQDLEDRQNDLRLSGNVSGANDLANQISTKRETLVQSGFLKASEGDQFKSLEETIHKDSVELAKIWTETNTILQGKYVNQ